MYNWTDVALVVLALIVLGTCFVFLRRLAGTERREPMQPETVVIGVKNKDGEIVTREFPKRWNYGALLKFAREVNPKPDRLGEWITPD